MLKGKTVLLGVTGGIAAYKAAALASALVKQRAAVEVVMTENAHPIRHTPDFRAAHRPPDDGEHLRPEFLPSGGAYRSGGTD